MAELSAEDQAKLDEWLRQPCERCGRPPPPPARGSMKDWHHGVELLCPDCKPPSPPDSPEIVGLLADVKALRRDLRDSDDPDEKANLREEIEDATEEIEGLREDAYQAVLDQEGKPDA